ncbi:HEAT repeat domain-containing protein, partial [Candidatus Micrarchaeota archaeon]|nr:HEAT repeat domain-containing protein [Candidatus Micrarchaeota archaeon]
MLGVFDRRLTEDIFHTLVKEGKRSIAPLAKALGSEDPHIKIRAAWAIGEIKEIDSRAVTSLVNLLRGESNLAAEAAWALGEMGAISSVRALIPLALSGESRAREAAEAALLKIIDKCPNHLVLAG